jgi:hypothetical protein
MIKPYLEQLETWLEEKNLAELDKVEWKVRQDLRKWGSISDEMDKDKGSWLWGQPLAVAVHKEYKKLKALVKRIDAMYKKLEKPPKEKF